MIRLIVDDWIAGMRGLPDASVQMIGPTSPPYLGLRSYLPAGHPDKHKELGSEATPEAFVAALVEGFREARRILRPDGLLCINLGDSYAGSGKGPTGHNGFQNAEQRQGFKAGYVKADGTVSKGGRKSKTDAPDGYKAKDLMQIPFRVSLALQGFSTVPGAALMQMSDGLRDARPTGDWAAVEIIEGALRRWAAASMLFDGWYLRSVIPWLKRNPMPESVTDRPASAVEYLFLFSRSRTYYWDAEAIRQAHSPNTHAYAAGGSFDRPGEKWPTWGKDGTQSLRGIDRATYNNPAGRAYRNSDAFFATWQGLVLDDAGDPLALVVNPQPRKGSHYARFPNALVEPFVKAGTSAKGCCPACGAPWRRQTERIKHGERVKGHRTLPALTATGNHGTTGFDGNGMRYDVDYRLETRTLGWEPGCSCDAGPPIPCTILDPFGGGGTTGLVADRLGRDAILIELNEGYAADAKAEIEHDAGFLADVTMEMASGPIPANVAVETIERAPDDRYHGLTPPEVFDAMERAFIDGKGGTA